MFLFLRPRRWPLLAVVGRMPRRPPTFRAGHTDFPYTFSHASILPPAGMWTFGKVVSVLGDRLPAYPLTLSVEWKKPIYQPSEITIVERSQDGGKVIYWEVVSSDGVHVHAEGVVRSDPHMKLIAA